MTPFYGNWLFWLYFGVWLPYTLFVLFYGLRSPWYRSALGRSLLLSKTVIALLASTALLRMIFGPDYWLRETLLVLIIGGALIAGWTQFLLLLREQRESRHTNCPRRRATDFPGHKENK